MANDVAGSQGSSDVVPRRWLTRHRLLEMIESVSRRALSGSSGSYHVRGAELARDRKLKSLSATVVFLDDTQYTFQLDVSVPFLTYCHSFASTYLETNPEFWRLQKRARGQSLLDLVFQHLELIEKDYFGLQYAENGNVSSSCPNPDIMVWEPLVVGRNWFLWVFMYLSNW